MLQLNKPLAFIDLETTGVNLGLDRIIEIAIVKILTDGTKNVKRKLINPGMPIPKTSSDVHGITDEMVKDAPPFKQVAQELKQMLDGCDLAGYNSNRFDIPLLMEEFLRAQVEFDMRNRKLLDVQNIFHKMEPRTLGAAYKFYCNKVLEGAHGAEVDATATLEILEAQLERYPGLGNSVDSILKLIRASIVPGIPVSIINDAKFHLQTTNVKTNLAVINVSFDGAPPNDFEIQYKVGELRSKRDEIYAIAKKLFNGGETDKEWRVESGDQGTRIQGQA